MEKTLINEQLEVAIAYLKTAKKIDIEQVDIQATSYDDGTLRLSIDIDYPPERK